LPLVKVNAPNFRALLFSRNDANLSVKSEDDDGEDETDDEGTPYLQEIHFYLLSSLPV